MRELARRTAVMTGGVYDEAKRSAEALTIAYGRTHGVDTGIVRIFNTFGRACAPLPGERSRTFNHTRHLGST